jgi:hypothetical protein
MRRESTGESLFAPCRRAALRKEKRRDENLFQFTQIARTIQKKALWDSLSILSAFAPIGHLALGFASPGREEGLLPAGRIVVLSFA